MKNLIRPRWSCLDNTLRHRLQYKIFMKLCHEEIFVAILQFSINTLHKKVWKWKNKTQTMHKPPRVYDGKPNKNVCGILTDLEWSDFRLKQKTKQNNPHWNYTQCTNMRNISFNFQVMLILIHLFFFMLLIIMMTTVSNQHGWFIFEGRKFEIFDRLDFAYIWKV